MPQPDPDPRNFVEILERVWWRLDRALDADSLRASARLYVAEAIMYNTFSLIDHHESPSMIDGSLDILADACQEHGARAVLCYGATERNGGRDEARRGLEECRRFLSQNQRPLIRGVVGLHASFTVSDDTIQEAAALAREHSTVLHVHVAEDAADVRDARERGYTGVIDRFDRLGALIPGSIFAHGVHLTADEVRCCATNECWLVQNPRSNRGNRVGYPSELSCSDRVALGTDGYPADMGVEEETLIEEARAASDDLSHARERLAAGHRLIAERFADGPGDRETAVVPPEEAERLRAQAASRISAIREEARAQSEKLWTRMEKL
jgi:cytosine/adenosine deaminase-related metal-dependent hydrolase